jgi:NADH-quinone oxidoreductase subunit H
VPLSFGAFLLTAIWMLAEPSVGRSVQLVISVVTFVTWALLMVHFVRRVQYNLREARVAIHPFL